MAYLDKNHPSLSYTRQCGLLSVPRSSTYYKAKPVSQRDVDLLNEIRSIWERYPFYGGRRIQAYLARQGTKVNLKKVRRLMGLEGIQAIYPKPKTSTTGPENRKYPYLLNGLSLGSVNQVWGTDITYRTPLLNRWTPLLNVYINKLLSYKGFDEV